MRLRSPEVEAEACRKAFRNVKSGALVWHCHHEILVETLRYADGDANRRIDYILSSKARAEQPLRLRLFRPVKMKKLPAALLKSVQDARDAYETHMTDEYCALLRARDRLDRASAKLIMAARRLHKSQCLADCPWNGRTIFSRKWYASHSSK
jgi:hypothetical protein